MTNFRQIVTVAVMTVPLALTACGDGDGTTAAGEQSTLPEGSESVSLDPANFTTEIDNPYWPMTVGSTWVYKETDGKGAEQRVEVTVTDQTKRIANGVEARVVHDVVSEDGEPIEVTDDWYAQDSDGNIWYLGEDTAEYENGKVSSREGSFEAGVDGALPGIAIPASPEPGLAYRQEFLEGEAEDRAKVLALGESVSVPFGKFTDTLKTEDVNPLEDPPGVENKLYAGGVGPVLTIGVSGSAEGSREALVSYTPGP
jgi:hypothetical protein